MYIYIHLHLHIKFSHLSETMAPTAALSNAHPK